VLTYRQ